MVVLLFVVFLVCMPTWRGGKLGFKGFEKTT
jgi:hypothetical protein